MRAVSGELRWVPSILRSLLMKPQWPLLRVLPERSRGALRSSERSDIGKIDQAYDNAVYQQRTTMGSNRGVEENHSTLTTLT